MIGCMILGGLAGLLAVKLFHHRRHGHHGYGWGGRGGWGPGFHRDDADLHFGRGRRRMERVLSFVTSRLDTTPRQERVIAEAMEELQQEMSTAKDEGKKTRADLASALRKPAFDEVLFGELYARHDDVILKARKAFVGFSAKLHDTLEEEQRERLASFIERGSGGGFFGGSFARGPGW